MRSFVLVLAGSLLVLPATAQAHFDLLAPPSSNTSNATEGGKGAPPCGPDGTPSTAPVAVQGGQMLALKINETVYHPGFYRVALSLHSRSELPADPAVQTAVVMGMTQSVSADSTEMGFPVLANNLFADHKATGQLEAQIAIPNVNCDKCTLQVIEFMAQHGANPGGGYFYHHCADLKITADSSKPIFEPTAGSGGGGGSNGGASSTAGAGGTSAAAGTSAGGTSAAGGSATGGSVSSSGGSVPIGTSGGGTGGSANAIAGAPSVAGAVNAGASGGQGALPPGEDHMNDDGGCALSTRAAGSKPLLSLLLGLLVLGRRRNRRR